MSIFWNCPLAAQPRLIVFTALDLEIVEQDGKGKSAKTNETKRRIECLVERKEEERDYASWVGEVGETECEGKVKRGCEGGEDAEVLVRRGGFRGDVA